MKTLAYILSIISLCSCHQNAQKKIRYVFQPTFTLSQIATRVTGNGDDLCSSNVYLNSDSTFTYEYGCEGESTISFGKWHVFKDSVELKPYPKNKVNIAFNIGFSKSNADSIVTFIVRDKASKPIWDFIIQPFNKVPYYIFTSKGMFESGADNALLVYEDQISTNDDGILKIKKRKADSLDFSKLYPLTGKKFTISTDNLPDTIKLTIDINSVFFSYSSRYSKDIRPFKMKFNDGRAVF